MTHFVNNDGLNIFRLPVGWQYLVNNNLGGTLSSSNFAEYNTLVQGCLNTGKSVPSGLAIISQPQTRGLLHC
jgi:endoglucanase